MNEDITEVSSTSNRSIQRRHDESQSHSAPAGQRSDASHARPPSGNGNGDCSSTSSSDGHRRVGNRRNGNSEQNNDGRRNSRGRQPRVPQNSSNSDSPDDAKKAKRRKRHRSRSVGKRRGQSSSHDRQKSRHKHRHKIKVQMHDGSTCVEVFLSIFEDSALYNRWDDKDRLAHLKASLSGPAAYLLTESRGLQYEDLKEKLRRRYSNREQKERFKVELRTRRRKSGDTFQALCHDIERLVALAYPEASAETRDLLGRDAFIDALNNASLEFKIREKEISTMTVALSTAMRLEALQNSRRMTEESAAPRRARQVASGKHDRPADQLSAANDGQSSPQKKQKSRTRKKSPKKSPPI